MVRIPGRGEAAAAALRIAKRIDLLTTARYSDFTIRCQRAPGEAMHEFKVHRAIMLGESEYFDTLMDGGFKECSDQEATIDEDPTVPAIILWTIYTGELPSDSIEATQGTPLVTKSLLVDDMSLQIELFEATGRLLCPNAHELFRQAFIQSIVRVSQTPTSELEFHKPLEEIANYTFGRDVLLSEETKNLVAWALFQHMGLARSQILATKLPLFYLQVARELEYMCMDEWIGMICHCGSMGHDVIGKRYVMVQREDDRIDWLGCVCWFRGICSDQCKVTDLKTRREMCKYCDGCRKEEIRRSDRFCCHLRSLNGVLEVRESDEVIDRDGFDFGPEPNGWWY